ncbi:MAG: ThiF family adenylyltransferase [Candidatus Anammoxibacter sp.]
MHSEFSVAMPTALDSQLNKFLIREDGQEDLMFALWSPSFGLKRLTGLLHTLIYPEDGDRQVHGNASFNTPYFERVCSMALKEKSGIVFLHSHPGPGWQGMSQDDILAENKIAGTVFSLTDLPLVGMTLGNDGIWSARMWPHSKGKHFDKRCCISVRSVGRKFDVSFADHLISKPEFSVRFKRTANVWGKENHAKLARLRIGIVGIGSVGSVVAEILARAGMERFVLIDFDEIQPHNLDRLSIATKNDIGQLKVETAKCRVHLTSTAMRTEVATVPYSIAEKEGYTAALDCDLLFSCVDRPRARKILNHFAYAHLIPVIDGGIQVRFKRGNFSGVDWQLQTVAPERPCLECLQAYDPADVVTEIEGKLDDPTYLKGLPSDHKFKRNENVFAFSINLASLEVMQFVAFATGIAGITDFGVQRYRYNPGILESDLERICKQDCEISNIIAQGDRYYNLHGRDLSAETARLRQKKP